MQFPKSVKMVEVGARDGLQNISQTVPTDIKIEFINRLSRTGLSVIEVTSFVSQEKIPQLSDNTAVFTGILKLPQVSYPVLVPNVRGFKDAIKAGATEVAVFIAASETFSQRNIHCSIAESFVRAEDVIKLANQHKVKVRGYISCICGCPYEGKIFPLKITEIAKKLHELGCYELSLGDTIGVGTAQQVQQLLKTVLSVIPLSKIAVHFHDTYNQALTNIYASLELGVSVVDSSVSGLGGCPYAQGASGNVASEDVLYLLNGLNINTGVDLNKLIEAGKYISDYLNRPLGSKVAIEYQRK